MAEAHRQTLQRLNESVLRLDFEAAVQLCTEDTVWIFEGDRTLTGRQQVREWMAATYLDPPVLNVERVIGDGEFLVAIGDIVVSDSRGAPIKSRYADVWRFSDGLLAELHAFVVEET